MKLGKQTFEQRQSHPRRVGCRLRDNKLPCVEHTETPCRLVITRLSDEFSVRLTKVRLPCHASKRRQVAKALRIVKNGRVPPRRITADPVIRAPVILLPYG